MKTISSGNGEISVKCSKMIKKPMDNLGLTVEQAMSMLKVSEEDCPKYSSILENQDYLSRRPFWIERGAVV